MQITKFCETFKIENKHLLVKVLIKKCGMKIDFFNLETTADLVLFKN